MGRLGIPGTGVRAWVSPDVTERSAAVAGTCDAHDLGYVPTVTNLAHNLVDAADGHGDRPAVLWIVDQLRKGPTGKILRREVTAPEHL
jgi:acyl-CoA synthetase (AMP-forming)/AMP-acid ligase II